MSIRIALAKPENVMDKHFLHRLLLSDGQQYALGLRENHSSYKPTMWYVSKEGKTHYIDADSLVCIHTYPKKGSSPAVRLWSTAKDAPAAYAYNITFDGSIYKKEVYAITKDQAREKAIRWFAFTVRLPHNVAHDWANKHPKDFVELK